MAGASAPEELSEPLQAEVQPNTAGSLEGEDTAVSDPHLKRDWLEVAMVTVNNHLQAFRMLPWVMGGLGALLIIKYSGMYHKASDIPSQLLARGATLRGVALGVWPDGHLDIWHTPPGRRWLRWKHLPPKTYTSEQVLRVQLAAVSILQSDTAHSWMTSNLIGRSIWFRPLHYSSSDDCLHCVVKYRKRYLQSKVCVNTKLLSLGLATLQESVTSCHSNEELIAFLSEGVRAEGSAQRKGVGAWKGSPHETRWRKLARFIKLRK